MPLILIKLEMPLPSSIVLSLGGWIAKPCFFCKKIVGEMKKFMGLDVCFLKENQQKFQVITQNGGTALYKAVLGGGGFPYESGTA